MLKKRETLSPMLFGLSALTIATGMPTIHDSTTEISAISAVSGPAARDHLGDAFGAEERVAETAAGDVADPVQVLHDSGSLSPSCAI